MQGHRGAIHEPGDRRRLEPFGRRQDAVDLGTRTLAAEGHETGRAAHETQTVVGHTGPSRGHRGDLERSVPRGPVGIDVLDADRHAVQVAPIGRERHEVGGPSREETRSGQHLSTGTRLRHEQATDGRRNTREPHDSVGDAKRCLGQFALVFRSQVSRGHRSQRHPVDGRGLRKRVEQPRLGVLAGPHTHGPRASRRVAVADVHQCEVAEQARGGELAQDTRRAGDDRVGLVKHEGDHEQPLSLGRPAVGSSTGDRCRAYAPQRPDGAAAAPRRSAATARSTAVPSTACRDPDPTAVHVARNRLGSATRCHRALRLGRTADPRMSWPLRGGPD